MARTKNAPLRSTIVVVFKPKANSKVIKFKAFKNYILDWILDVDCKLVGIPDTAEILEVGMGEGMMKEYKNKYNKNK